MQLSLTPSQPLDFHLARGQVLSSPRLDGVVIEVRTGSVWITFEKEGIDHVLQPGERLSLGAGGRAVMESLGESDVSVWPSQVAQGPKPEVLRRCINSVVTDLPRCTRNWIQTLSSHRLGLETL